MSADEEHAAGVTRRRMTADDKVAAEGPSEVRVQPQWHEDADEHPDDRCHDSYGDPEHDQQRFQWRREGDEPSVVEDDRFWLWTRASVFLERVGLLLL